VRIDHGTYMETAALLGPLLAAIRPTPFELTGDDLPAAASAVYIAVDEHDEVVYVGSVRRSNDRALRRRVAEHRRDRPEARTWRRLWVLLLVDTAGTGDVRWAEARVGRHLRPHDNRRLPRFPRHTRTSGQAAGQRQSSDGLSRVTTDEP